MPSIGGNSVLTLRGEFQTLAQTLEPITRPNIDGVAYRVVGQRGGPFRMLSIVDVDDDAAAEALADTYKALIGTLVTVLDDHGQTHTNIVVLDSRILRKQPVKQAGGGLSTSQGYLVTTVWTLEESNVV